MDMLGGLIPSLSPLSLFMTNHSAMLEEALGTYEKAAGELEEFRARVARAEVDEETTLSDHSLSEDQAIKQLTNAQKLKAVYTARAAHKEKELTRLGPELEEAIIPAERELLAEITQEAQRRSQAVLERVLEVLGPLEDPSAISVELATIVSHAAPVRLVQALQPAGYYEPGRAEHAIAHAREVLAARTKLTEALTTL